MKVISVEYREESLISTAQFENARVQIGVTIAVADGELANDSLQLAKDFVRQELAVRITEITDRQYAAKQTDALDKVRRKYHL